MQAIKAKLSFDSSEAQRQLSELTELLSARFSDGIPDFLLSDLAELSNDLVFAELRSTVRTDGILEIVQGFRFGAKFDHIFATLRAGNGIIHGAGSLLMESR